MAGSFGQSAAFARAFTNTAGFMTNPYYYNAYAAGGLPGIYASYTQNLAASTLPTSASSATSSNLGALISEAGVKSEVNASVASSAALGGAVNVNGLPGTNAYNLTSSVANAPSAFAAGSAEATASALSAIKSEPLNGFGSAFTANGGGAEGPEK